MAGRAGRIRRAPCRGFDPVTLGNEVLVFACRAQHGARRLVEHSLLRGRGRGSAQAEQLAVDLDDDLAKGGRFLECDARSVQFARQEESVFAGGDIEEGLRFRCRVEGQIALGELVIAGRKAWLGVRKAKTLAGRERDLHIGVVCVRLDQAVFDAPRGGVLHQGKQAVTLELVTPGRERRETLCQKHFDAAHERRREDGALGVEVIEAAEDHDQEKEKNSILTGGKRTGKLGAGGGHLTDKEIVVLGAPVARARDQKISERTNLGGQMATCRVDGVHGQGLWG